MNEMTWYDEMRRDALPRLLHIEDIAASKCFIVQLTYANGEGTVW